MSVYEEQLKRIQDKLQLLVKQQQQLQKENQQLKAEIEGWKLKTTEQQQVADQLKQQVDIIKFSGGQMDEAEKKQFEKKIGSYLKEIDRCIALLSR